MNNDERNEFNVAFGEYIRTARINKKIQQGAVSKYLGVAQAYYCRIEAGTRNVDLALAAKICDFLGLSLDAFVAAQKK